jgi:hypothetical protein
MVSVFETYLLLIVTTLVAIIVLRVGLSDFKASLLSRWQRNQSRPPL